MEWSKHPTYLLMAVGWLSSFAGANDAYFEIRVLDKETRRGVPLVELVSVDEVRHVTDNAGRIAYSELGHAGQTIFFRVHAQGYRSPKDGFGIEGARFKIEPGKAVELELERTNIAERLYRITGQALYRDTILLGRTAPVREPLGSGMVAGQDSVQVVPYRDKLFWFWGDTNRLAYPLGLFRTAGATSLLPSRGGLEPSAGIDLQYFTGDNGFARAMAEVADPKGVVWIDGLATVRDVDERERLVAHFSRRPGLAEQLEHGLMLFNDERHVLEVAAPRELDDDWRYVRDHPTHWQDGDREFLIFGNPFPVTRVRARLANVLDATKYESWSCVAPADDPAKARPRRTADGQLDWRWQIGKPVTLRDEERWIKTGVIRAEEARFLPEDVARPGRRVVMHSGTVHWNAHRKRWIMIAIEMAWDRESPSMLGEVWYAEAESPQGPFRKSVRVASHDKQSFYNPCHHPFFDEAGGRFIYFEGTYCNSFTSSPATQRYNYNQILYRLDLDHTAIQSEFSK